MPPSASFGPVTLRVRGDHPTVPIVAQELTTAASTKDNESTGVDVDVGFARSEEATRGIAGGRIMQQHRVAPTGYGALVEYRLKGGALVYRVRLPGSLTDEDAQGIKIEFPRWTGSWGQLLDPWTRLATRESSTFHQLMAKNLIYEVLDPIVWVRLLRKEATLVHASAVVSPGGGTRLVAGTGGVGKSTALLELMSDEGWRYLGDDLVIVGASGQCWRHPKNLQVYDYNLLHMPEWRGKVLSGLSPAARRWWPLRARLLGSKRVRRRLSAAELFGLDRVASHGEIESFIWLSPGGGDKPALRRASSRELARLITGAMADEMWDFLQLLNLAGLSGLSHVMIGDIIPDTARVAEAALNGVDCGILALPDGNPRGVASVVANFPS